MISYLQGKIRLKSYKFIKPNFNGFFLPFLVMLTQKNTDSVFSKFPILVFVYRLERERTRISPYSGLHFTVHVLPTLKNFTIKLLHMQMMTANTLIKHTDNSVYEARIQLYVIRSAAKQ